LEHYQVIPLAARAEDVLADRAIPLNPGDPTPIFAL